MNPYLGTAWLDALRDALAQRRFPAPAGDRVVLQLVIECDTGPVAYAVRIEQGRADVVEGMAVDADVTFETDRATAWAISHGDESAQTAFTAGRLRVAGDVAVLVDNLPVLAGFDDLFAPLRASTRY